MDNTKYRFIFSLTITLFFGYCYHPSRDPQGLAMITFSYYEWIFAAITTFLFLYFILVKNILKKNDMEADFICPKCEKIQINIQKTEKHICPDCKVELERLNVRYTGKYQSEIDLNNISKEYIEQLLIQWQNDELSKEKLQRIAHEIYILEQVNECANTLKPTCKETVKIIDSMDVDLITQDEIPVLLNYIRTASDCDLFEADTTKLLNILKSRDIKKLREKFKHDPFYSRYYLTKEDFKDFGDPDL